MKVLAIKGIEEMGRNQWGVRFTRMHGAKVQEAVFTCRTQKQAEQKLEALLDILINHHGVDSGSTIRLSRAKNTCRRPGCSNPLPRYRKRYCSDACRKKMHEMARRSALRYCTYCKSRSRRAVIPREDGYVTEVCQNCGKDDLYIGSSGANQEELSLSLV